MENHAFFKTLGETLFLQKRVSPKTPSPKNLKEKRAKRVFQ